MADATGWEVEYTERGVKAVWSDDWSGHKLPPAHIRPLAIESLDADVVVMQRPTRHFWSYMIPLIQEQGIRVVVDMDDNFTTLPDTHVSYQLFHPQLHPERNWKWALEACKRADVVTTTTPALNAYYGHGHGVVIPNMVPERYLKIEPDIKMRVVGWSGSVRTHPGDLHVTAGAVARALDEVGGWGFHVIGTGVGVREALGLSEDPTNTGDEWVPFAAYPERLAELGIGIVPLEDIQFNRGKSALKLLEMSAVGVPAVASPTPDNRRAHQLGMGELAKSPNEWLRKTRALMRHGDYRAEVAGRSKEAAATQTYEAHVERWVDAWSGKSTKSTKTVIQPR